MDGHRATAEQRLSLSVPLARPARPGLPLPTHRSLHFNPLCRSMTIGGGRGQWLGGTMASAEHEPITGVWGQSPQRGPGAEPLVKGSGGRIPPEAESILVIGCPTEPANLAPVRENSMFCYGPLVSELGGRVHGAPQPRHWGAGAPRLRRLCQ